MAGYLQPWPSKGQARQAPHITGMYASYASMSGPQTAWPRGSLGQSANQADASVQRCFIDRLGCSLGGQDGERCLGASLGHWTYQCTRTKAYVNPKWHFRQSHTQLFVWYDGGQLGCPVLSSTCPAGCWRLTSTLSRSSQSQKVQWLPPHVVWPLHRQHNILGNTNLQIILLRYFIKFCILWEKSKYFMKCCFCTSLPTNVRTNSWERENAKLK